MSLINQMLQDLDKRSADGAGSAAKLEHIRAVPALDKNRGLGWVVLAMLSVVVGGLVWFWLRPTTSAVPVSPPVEQARPQIMKPEPSLSLAPLEMQRNVAAPSAPSEHMDLPTPETHPANHPKPAVVKNLPEPRPKPKLIETAPVSVPDKETETPVKPPVLAASNSTPSNVNKQMKELTPQQRAENEYRKSTALMQQGRVSESIAGLEQTIQIDPAHASARQTLVGLLIESKRQDEAIRKLQDGLSLDSSQVGMAMVLARLQVEKGDLHGGTETLQRSLPHAAERADYRAFLAALLQREGRNKEAIEQYLIALRKSPQSGVWWMGLGISLQAENRVADALESFNRAKATNSLTPELQAFVEQKIKQLQR